MGEWEEEVRKLEERSALAEVTAVVSPQKSTEYRDSSLIGNRPPVRPYSRTMPRLLWWS